MHPVCVNNVVLISDMGSSPKDQQEESDVVELLDMQWCHCTVPFLSLGMEQIKALFLQRGKPDELLGIQAQRIQKNFCTVENGSLVK